MCAAQHHSTYNYLDRHIYDIYIYSMAHHNPKVPYCLWMAIHVWTSRITIASPFRTHWQFGSCWKAHTSPCVRGPTDGVCSQYMECRLGFPGQDRLTVRTLVFTSFRQTLLVIDLHLEL